MAHPKQNTQVIKQAPNVAPLTIDSQFEQARIAFSAAKAKLTTPPRSNAKCKFVSPAVADRMAMLQPRQRTFEFSVPPHNDSKQCRIISKVIAQMFPVVNQETLS